MGPNLLRIRFVSRLSQDWADQHPDSRAGGELSPGNCGSTSQLSGAGVLSRCVGLEWNLVSSPSGRLGLTVCRIAGPSKIKEDAVMLVLSRKEGERIVIDSGVEGAPIVISVVEIRGGRVRIGIQAPRSVAVRRQELEFELPAGGTTPASFSVPSAVVVEPVRAEVHLASGSC